MAELVQKSRINPSNTLGILTLGLGCHCEVRKEAHDANKRKISTSATGAKKAKKAKKNWKLRTVYSESTRSLLTINHIVCMSELQQCTMMSCLKFTEDDPR